MNNTLPNILFLRSSGWPTYYCLDISSFTFFYSIWFLSSDCTLLFLSNICLDSSLFITSKISLPLYAKLYRDLLYSSFISCNLLWKSAPLGYGECLLLISSYCCFLIASTCLSLYMCRWSSSNSWFLISFDVTLWNCH